MYCTCSAHSALNKPHSNVQWQHVATLLDNTALQCQPEVVNSKALPSPMLGQKAPLHSKLLRWDTYNSSIGEMEKGPQATSNPKETLIPDTRPQKLINLSPSYTAQETAFSHSHPASHWEGTIEGNCLACLLKIIILLRKITKAHLVFQQMSVEWQCMLTTKGMKLCSEDTAVNKINEPLVELTF